MVINVRTNHVHAGVTANKKPDAVMSAFKANATRAMRDANGGRATWVRGNSAQEISVG